MFGNRKTDGNERTNPKEKVCGNCQSPWRDGDKYCRYCGAPLNHPSYKIREFYTIYGPMPVKRKHSCSKCGFIWTTRMMIDDEHYCPKYGTNVTIEEYDDEV